MMRGFFCALASARITPKPVPCLRCRSRMITSTGRLLNAASAPASESAVPTNSMSAICRNALVNRSVKTLESSTSNTLNDCVIIIAPLTANSRCILWVGAMSWRCLLYETVAQSIGGYVGVRRETHFLQDAAPVRTHGFHAEAELIGDIGDAPARRYLTKNLKFTGGEPRMQRLVGVTVEIGHQDFRERCADIAPAGQHRAHCLHHFLGITVLGEIAAGAGPQHIDGVLLLGQSAHDENLDIRVAGLNVPQDIQPAAVRHMNVEKHQVPFLFTKLIQSFIAAGGFTYGVNIGIRLEKLLEARSNHRMIVFDQYTCHLCSPKSEAR